MIHTPDGHVAIQIAHPEKPAWGTSTVDASAGVVVHHVQSDARSTCIGTDQPWPFKLEGDRLVIGDSKTWTRVLERGR